MTGPYGRTARRYHAAGWSPLPLPARKKKEPPTGWTGRDAPMASAADVEAWCEDRAGGNVALRLPPTVVGIDVDAHKGAAAAEAWDEFVRRFGPLPDTAPWCSSRDDGVSGIRLLAVPEGYQAVTVLGGAGEVIQHHHRYVIAPPSVHPDTGRAYRWVNAPRGQIPDARKLPPLPPAWLEGLGARSSAEPGGHGQTGWTDPDIDTLAEHGIPAGQPRHDDTLRDVVWKMRADGVSRAAVCAVWLTITGKTALKDPGWPWTGKDFDRHWLGACQKISPGDEPEPDQLAVLRSKLLDSPGLDTIPAPEPIISGLLYAGTLAWFTGKRSSGKSFVVLDWAGHIARGLDWHGRPVKQGPVLFIAAEGAAGLRQRVRAWEDRHGRMDGVVFLPRAIRLPVAADRVAELAAELGAILVVIDTQARCTIGWDENSSKDMGHLVESLDTIRELSGACVLTIHHEAVASTARPRGHSSVDGAADSVLRIEKDGDLLTLTNPKQKNVPEDRPVQLALLPHLDSAVVSLTAGLTHQIRTDSETAVLAIVRDLVRLNGETSWTAVQQHCDLSKATITRALKTLLDNGSVVKDGRKYRLPLGGEQQLDLSI
jgi:hypothetical protein